MGLHTTAEAFYEQYIQSTDLILRRMEITFGSVLNRTLEALAWASILQCTKLGEASESGIYIGLGLQAPKKLEVSV